MGRTKPGLMIFFPAWYGGYIKSNIKLLITAFQYLINGSAQILGSTFYIRTFSLDGIVDTTYPLFTDDICPVVLQRGKIPKWKLITYIFKTESWIGCLFVLLLILASWYFLQKMDQRINHSPRLPILVCMESFQIFITLNRNRNITRTFE